MLEVGRLPSLTASRSHFSAWCIVSAPLVLGLDVSDPDQLSAVWPIITNKAALAINQQWAGHPGFHVRSFTPPSVNITFLLPAPCNGSAAQAGWSFNGSRSDDGGGDGAVSWGTGGEIRCLDTDCCDGDATLVPCDSSSQRQHFSRAQPNHELMNFNGNCMGIDQASGNIPGVPTADTPPSFSVEGCNGDNTTAIVFTAAGEMRVNGSTCVTPTNHAPSDRSEKVHIWAKPQPGGALAVLLIADHWQPIGSVDLQLAWLPLQHPKQLEEGGSLWAVRDVWNAKDLPKMSASGSIASDPLDTHDSRLYVLSPA